VVGFERICRGSQGLVGIAVKLARAGGNDPSGARKVWPDGQEMDRRPEMRIGFRKGE
jgi:hypothetical protein